MAKPIKICIDNECDELGPTGFHFILNNGEELWGITREDARKFAKDAMVSYLNQGKTVTVIEYGHDITSELK